MVGEPEAKLGDKACCLNEAQASWTNLVFRQLNKLSEKEAKNFGIFPAPVGR
jgi:hypothetical protein